MNQAYRSSRLKESLNQLNSNSARLKNIFATFLVFQSSYYILWKAPTKILVKSTPYLGIGLLFFDLHGVYNKDFSIEQSEIHISAGKDQVAFQVAGRTIFLNGLAFHPICPNSFSIFSGLFISSFMASYGLLFKNSTS